MTLHYIHTHICIYIHAPQKWFKIYIQVSVNETLLYLPASDTTRQLQKCQARSATCLRKPIEGILGQLGHGKSRGKIKRCCQNWHCWAMEKCKALLNMAAKFDKAWKDLLKKSRRNLHWGFHCLPILFGNRILEAQKSQIQNNLSWGTHDMTTVLSHGKTQGIAIHGNKIW